MIYSPQLWYGTQSHIYVLLFGKQQLFLYPPYTYYNLLVSWHQNSEGKQRDTAVLLQCFKRILRMGIPTQRGRERGASPYIRRTRSTSQTRAMINDPDIPGSDTSSQTPFTESTTLTSRLLTGTYVIVHERRLNVFSHSYRLFVSA